MKGALWFAFVVAVMAYSKLAPAQQCDHLLDPGSTALSGAWFDPNQAGQGVMFAQTDDVLHYFYATYEGHQPVWFTGAARFGEFDNCVGDLRKWRSADREFGSSTNASFQRVGSACVGFGARGGLRFVVKHNRHPEKVFMLRRLGVE